MTNKVLVTGSAGFIGGYVVEELLARDYEVVGLDNYSKYGPVKRSYDDHPRYHFVEGDARDVELMTSLARDCDHLIAGAVLADVGKPLEFDKDASSNVIQGKFGQQVRHPFSGVALAYKHGIPGEVMHIIASHSHEGDKVERSIESIIFHHADFVDFDIAKLLGKRAAKK